MQTQGEKYTFMPIIIEKYRTIRTHKRQNVRLFKQNAPQQKVVDCHGENLIKNSHLGNWNKLIFKLVDYINPMTYKYPKLSKSLLFITEKLFITPKEISHMR